MIKKIFDKIKNKIKEMPKGNTESVIVGLILLFIIVFILLIWFFCACHSWLVLAFPTFVAFPKWAFVLLMFILAGGSSGSKSS